MSTVVQIYNMALAHLSSKARVASVDEVTKEAYYCGLYYDDARVEALADGVWDFAYRRATLAAIVNPLTHEEWPFAYAKPSDCLRILKVRAPGDDPARRTRDYSLETDPLGDSVIYTDVPEAEIEYIADEVVVGRFSAHFRRALSHLLASRIAGPIVGGASGIQLRNEQQGLYRATLRSAANLSQSQREMEDERQTYVPEWLRR